MSTRFANPEADAPFHNVLRGLAWTVFVLLAWIVFELTANAALSVVVFSAKFGWDDLLTALWLRRVDPWRQRAKACGWFYASSAFLKASIVAVVLMFATVFVIPAQIGPPIEFVTAVIEAFVGFGLSAVTTWLAFYVAWRHGVKVWVDSAIHQARRDRHWPPQDYCRINNAGPLLSAALALTAMPLIIVVVAGVFMIGEANGGANELTAMCCVAGVVAPLALIVWAIAWFKDRASLTVIAIVPSECWDTGNHLPVDHRMLDDTARAE